MEEKTVRQRIIEALRGGFLSAKDISKTAGIREKDVREHLIHAARSIHRGRGHERLVFEPSKCMGCGFTFRKRERLSTPSRCPVCRSEEITETRYGIMPRFTAAKKDNG